MMNKLIEKLFGKLKYKYLTEYLVSYSDDTSKTISRIEDFDNPINEDFKIYQLENNVKEKIERNEPDVESVLLISFSFIKTYREK